MVIGGERDYSSVFYDSVTLSSLNGGTIPDCLQNLADFPTTIARGAAAVIGMVTYYWLLIMSSIKAKLCLQTEFRLSAVDLKTTSGSSAMNALERTVNVTDIWRPATRGSRAARCPRQGGGWRTPTPRTPA